MNADTKWRPTVSDLADALKLLEWMREQDRYEYDSLTHAAIMHVKKRLTEMHDEVAPAVGVEHITRGETR